MNNLRYNFLDIWISAENLSSALKKIISFSFLGPNYVCFPDASVIKIAHEDPTLQFILNNSYLSLPDGKPSQLAARVQGLREVGTVSGYHLCRSLLQTNLTHYFYGGDQKVLDRMELNLRILFPQAKILGFKAPPFVALGDIAKDSLIALDIEEINLLQPDLVWIGISSPKQDYLMYHYHKQLDQSLMLGVGGVFLYLADESLKSPEWIKKIGLRWAYRLAMEPKRLWPKYLDTFTFLIRNSGFFLNHLLKKRDKL